jgi:TetR/AcrR family transcriptional regulator, transcriptional repressor for nem operon
LASFLFRERGFENVTVGEVMKVAGLTHGAFYAHFGSKQELQEAAVAYGQGVSAGRVRSYGATKKGRRAYADGYLSSWHRDSPGDGCTMAALAPEAARSPLSSRQHSSEDSRKFSPRAAGTEKKQSFKQPR